jgi:hypothetical protein
MSNDFSDIEECFLRQKEANNQIYESEKRLSEHDNNLKTHIKKEKEIVAQIRTHERSSAKRRLTKDELDDSVYQNEYYIKYIEELSSLQMKKSYEVAEKNRLERDFETRRQYLSFKKEQMSKL